MSDQLQLFLYPSQISHWDLVCALKFAYPDVKFKAYEMDMPADENIYVYDDEYNDGYTHEAMHAAHIALEMWDTHILETRCADQFPDVKEAIINASNAMQAVYQLIGQKFKDDEY
jgi:hypothetical protein